MRKSFLLLFFLSLTSCASTPNTRALTLSRGKTQVELVVYQPSSGKRLLRSVIVMPPTGGVTYLEKSYARSMAKKGAQVYVVKKWANMSSNSTDLSIHETLHKRAMAAIALVLTKVPKSHKVSIMGTSLGGIYTAVAASHFDRFDRVLTIAGGSPIPELIAYSDHSAMKKLREKRMAQWKFFNKDAYAKAIDEKFTFNPHKMKPRYKNKKKALIVLTKDKAVPTKVQRSLEKLWKPDLVYHLEEGHFFGIIKTWWFFSDELVNFLIGDSKES